MQPLYHDRSDAGLHLAAKLAHYSKAPSTIVLGLPRGGIPVATEVAKELDLPLDVFFVKRIANDDTAGPFANGGLAVYHEEYIHSVPKPMTPHVFENESMELARRELLYRGDSQCPDIEGKTVILVDDGLASGSALRTAICAVREMKPARVVVAIPVALPSTCVAIRDVADEVVCTISPRPLIGIGHWYEDFSQTTDEEVAELLKQSRRMTASGRSQRAVEKRKVAG